MLKRKSDIYNIVLIIAALVISAIMYKGLPDMVPIHWNSAGKIDGYGSKMFGLLLSPVIMFFTWSGMKFLRKIDPKKENYKKFEKAYAAITCFLITFFFVIHITILAAASGYGLGVDKIIPIGVGVLFIAIGNYMPKIKRNYFIGIKTPWTFDSEVSWKKTHELGGKLFVISGIIVAASVLFINGGAEVIVIISVVLLASIIPIVASYFYAKEDK